VAAAAMQLSCVRDVSVRAPFKRPLSLTGGPSVFIYLSRFSSTHILIFDLLTFLMSKIHKMFHKDRGKHNEQLPFLAQLQIPKGLQVINSVTKSKLKIPRILTGFKPF
jgi:hypothetical protein